jgi:hypothetical protein
MDRLVYQGDPELLQPFIDAGWSLVREGVKAITGNCGFMVLYHEMLAREFPVPVFMSSLLQLPFISRMLKPGEKVGIVTANSKTLTAMHLQIATNDIDIPIAVAGMEDQKQFYDAIHAEKGTLDFDKVEREVVEVRMHRSAPLCCRSPGSRRVTCFRFLDHDQLRIFSARSKTV